MKHVPHTSNVIAPQNKSANPNGGHGVISKAESLAAIGLPLSLGIRQQRGLLQMETEQYQKGDALRFTQFAEPPNPRRCFVIMPLSPEFAEVYQDIIKPVVTDLGILPIRADEIYSRNAIIDDIWMYIQKSAWIIADLTGRNPNVFYERAQLALLR